MEKEIYPPSFKNMFKAMDLTVGSTFKAILYFAIPILLSSLIGNAFGLINSLVMKQTVGGDAVTAINSTGAISSLLFNFAYGASSGFAVITSHEQGAHNEDGIKKSFAGSLVLSLIIGFFLMAIGIPFLRPMLWALNISAQYYQRAYDYFLIILISFPFMLLANFLGNYLRALGNSFMPLLIGLLTTLAHIALAFLLTGVFHYDVSGVAFATIGANLLNVAITFLYYWIRYPSLRMKKDDFKVPWKMVKDLLAMGIPLGFQWSILFIGSFIQSSKVNLFGNGLATKASACYSSYEGYLTIPLSAVATSLLSFVGQNFGAGRLGRIKKGIKEAFFLDLFFYAIVVAIGLSTAQSVPYIFLPANEVNDKLVYYTATYLDVLAPCLILQGVLQLSRSALQGIKKPLIPFLSGCGELGARAFVCYLVPTWIDPVNPLSDRAYLGICFSNPSAWLMSVLIMTTSVLALIFFNKKFVDAPVAKLP